MNEETIVNPYSPIDHTENDNYELIKPSLNVKNNLIDKLNVKEICKKEFSEEDEEGGCIEEENQSLNNVDNLKESDLNQINNNELKSNLNDFQNDPQINLQNDDISDDENFKDEELDFEEVDNSRGAFNEEQLKSQQKRQQKAAEDGEVNSEEELEDGEVKEEDSDNDDDQLEGLNTNNLTNQNKLSSANLNSLCRFYSKGLCTWGNQCRFIHQKPPGTTSVYNSPKSINQLPIINKQNPINKSNENLNMNQSKVSSLPNNNYNQKYPSNNLNQYSKPSNSYNQNVSGDNQYWDRTNNMKFQPIKKDNQPFTKSYRSDESDHSKPSGTSSKYHQQPSVDYSRNTTSFSFYTSKNIHQQSSSYHQPSSSINYRPSSSSSNNFESEYERKRRLAFQSAPWNDSMNEMNSNLSPSNARNSPIDRHSQSSSSKLYSSNKHNYPHHTQTSSNYVKKNENTTPAEHYRDPWRRSKSPQVSQNFSAGGSSSGRVTHPPQHSSTGTPIYTKSKSDSDSNFSTSEPELIEQQQQRQRRLDPNFANRQRPSSYHRESSNGEIPSLDINQRTIDHHHPSFSSKKSYYNKHQLELADNQQPNYHSATASSTYQKSSNTNEIDIPNYEKPKNLPPRTRKDSWSDSDSCSSSSNSSYSGSGQSESDSDREPYSRTNKFESTREVVGKLKGDDVFSNEPSAKRQRTISESSKPSRSPYSPSNDYSTMSRYSSSGRKKQLIMNSEELGSSYDEDGLESNERSSQKKFKNRTFEQTLERNGSGKHKNNETDSGDQKKDKKELLQQLKLVEEAIARKRSKMK